MYVIRRTDGAFVTPSGSEHSYTWDLMNAQTFSSTEAATRHGVCSNESVVPIASLLPSPR